MRPAMSMMEHYSDAKVGVPSLIRFSASLPGLIRKKVVYVNSF